MKGINLGCRQQGTFIRCFSRPSWINNIGAPEHQKLRDTLIGSGLIKYTKKHSIEEIKKLQTEAKNYCQSASRVLRGGRSLGDVKVALSSLRDAEKAIFEAESCGFMLTPKGEAYLAEITPK